MTGITLCYGLPIIECPKDWGGVEGEQITHKGSVELRFSGIRLIYSFLRTAHVWYKGRAVAGYAGVEPSELCHVVYTAFRYAQRCERGRYVSKFIRKRLRAFHKMNTNN